MHRCVGIKHKSKKKKRCTVQCVWNMVHLYWGLLLKNCIFSVKQNQDCDLLQRGLVYRELSYFAVASLQFSLHKLIGVLFFIQWNQLIHLSSSSLLYLLLAVTCSFCMVQHTNLSLVAIWHYELMYWVGLQLDKNLIEVRTVWWL